MKGKNAGPLAGGLMTELESSGQKDDATSGSEGARTTAPRNGFGERLERFLESRDDAEACVRCESTSRDAWMHEGGSGDVWLVCAECGLETRHTEGGRDE